MEVFLMVRRRKTSMFLDAKTDTPVLEVKKMIEGIMNVAVVDQQLYYLAGASAMDNALDPTQYTLLEDNKLLGDYGINTQTARPQLPATIALSTRDSAAGIHEFEAIGIDPLSIPPELPEVMRPKDANIQHPTE